MNRAIIIVLFAVLYALKAMADGCQSADFSFSYDIPNCTGQFLFQGNTDCGVGAGNSIWVWDFGDGSPQVFNVMNPTHEYLYEGVYTVTLWMYPTCHGPGNPPCVNTEPITVLFPNMAPIVPVVASNYNGNEVSCTDACDGIIVIDQIGAGYSIEWVDFPPGLDTVYNVCPGTYVVYSQPPQGCGFTEGIVEVVNPPPVQFNYTQDSTGCFGSSSGVVTLSAYGGAPSYSYEWDDGTLGPEAIDLAAGNHGFTVLDANGCSLQGEVTVDELPELYSNAFVSSDYNSFDISCYDGSDGMADANPGGGSPPYSFEWSDLNNQELQIATGLQQGDYSVVITDSQGCQITDLVSLFHPNPILASLEITSEYNGVPISCYLAEDGSMELSEIYGGTGFDTGDYSYQWYSVPPGCNSLNCLNAIPGQTTYALDNIGEGNYAVLSTDLNGCTNLTYLSIDDPSPIQIDLSVSTNYNGWPISCYGEDDGGLSSVVSGGIPGYDLVWSNGVTTLDNNAITAGIYTLEVSDLNNCPESASIEVVQPDPVEIAVEVVSDYNGQDISCYDASDGALLADGGGGVPPYSFFWNDGTPGSLNDGLPGGNYTVTLYDLNGCNISVIGTLVPPPPIVTDFDILTDFNGYPISCFGYMDGVVLGNASGGTGQLNYDWEGNTTGPENNLMVQAGAGELLFTVSDSNNCIETISVNLNQPEPLGAYHEYLTDYNGFEISCFGFEDGAFQMFGTGGVPQYSFEIPGYDFGPGEPVEDLGAGLYPITLTDLNGCVYQTEVLLTQPTPLQTNTFVISDYNGSQISCTDSSDAAAEVIPGGGVQPYYFLWEDGSVGNTSYWQLSPGYVSVLLTDANGCQRLDSVLISEPTPVVLNIVDIQDYNGYDVSCYGNTDGAVEVLPEGGTGAHSLFWDEIPGGISNSSLGAGEHMVTVYDLNGCGDTVLFVLNEPELLECYSQVLSNYNGYSVSCPGYNDGVAQSGAIGGVTPYVFSWSNNLQGELNTSLSVADSSVLITDLNGCTTLCTFVLTEPTPIVADFTIFADTCGRYVGEVWAETAGGVPPLIPSWWSDGSALPGEEAFEMVNVPEGNYVLQVMDMNQCVQSFPIQIAEVPWPVLDFSIIPSPACTERPVTFSIDSDKEITSWYWVFDNDNYSEAQYPVQEFYYPGEHEVSLFVQDIHQCTIDTTLYFYLLPEMNIWIPNAFTPNNDGLNDFFGAEGMGVENFHMQIFDRWGEVIFESYDMNRKWDGSFRTGDHYVKTEVYNWKVVASGPCTDAKEYRGMVVLLR